MDRIADAVRELPPAPRRAVPTAEDLRGAAAIFLLVFLSTVPVALPFMFLSDVAVALRTSNAIAIALLFLVGIGLGKHLRWRPYWVTGAVVALFGVILVLRRLRLAARVRTQLSHQIRTAAIMLPAVSAVCTVASGLCSNSRWLAVKSSLAPNQMTSNGVMI